MTDSIEPISWSPWHRVADVLTTGWNVHDVPWKIGVYRFRVRPDHASRPSEVVYVDRKSVV